MDTQKNNVKAEIQKCLDAMRELKVDSEEYEIHLKRLKALQDIKTASSVSPDAVVGVVSSLASILIITNYERVNVLTSRAMQFVRRAT